MHGIHCSRMQYRQYSRTHDTELRHYRYRGCRIHQLLPKFTRNRPEFRCKLPAERTMFTCGKRSMRFMRSPHTEVHRRSGIHQRTGLYKVTLEPCPQESICETMAEEMITSCRILSKSIIRSRPICVDSMRGRVDIRAKAKAAEAHNPIQRGKDLRVAAVQRSRSF